MATDMVQGGQQAPRSSSLFRPVPPSKLQTNLSEYYDRTADYVDDQMNEITGQPNSPSKAEQNQSVDDNPPKRLNPQGMGTVIDMFI